MNLLITLLSRNMGMYDKRMHLTRGHMYSGLEVSFEKSKETKNKYNNNFFFFNIIIVLFLSFFFFLIMTRFFIFLLFYHFLFFSFFFFFKKNRRSGLAVSKAYKYQNLDQYQNLGISCHFLAANISKSILIVRIRSVLIKL